MTEVGNQLASAAGFRFVYYIEIYLMAQKDHLNYHHDTRRGRPSRTAEPAKHAGYIGRTDFFLSLVLSRHPLPDGACPALIAAGG